MDDVGTNFMLRANAAFAVSGTASGNAEAGLEEGLHRFEMFSEHQISEDVELGARLHAAGYKSAFTDANVATGEVCAICNPSTSALLCTSTETATHAYRRWRRACLL